MHPIRLAGRYLAGVGPYASPQLRVPREVMGVQIAYDYTRPVR